MKEKRNIFILVIVLVIINTVILIINNYKGKSIVENMIFYIIDILATFWIIKKK